MPELKTFMKLAGEKFEIYRNNVKIGIVEGLPNREKGTNRPYIGFYPNTDIEIGDWIIGQLSKDKFYIEEKKSDVINGKVFQIKGYYLTERELEKVELEKKTTQTIIYNLNGTNSKVNNNSTDRSINVIDMTSEDLFNKIRNLIQENINDTAQKQELNEIVNQMEVAQGTRKFNELYTKFTTFAANHITIFTPLIPALSQMIQS
ncbi:hypothetical protein [Bacillus infantis]|uniref:Uncharacterized protein n=1 Tax=Bacillus infantis TaxID=324767 RepID=A0A5D4SSP1_9BACI|nr:hypothetical protein [Bacillus infantis]TYS64816.1 hypothetical protein FZD47_05440 [Bacillus infantis]